MFEALKQVGAGRPLQEVGRQCGASAHTIHAWKAKYGGMDVREENERLKGRTADLAMDKDALQPVIRKAH